jgi:hypothetical protein
MSLPQNVQDTIHSIRLAADKARSFVDKGEAVLSNVENNPLGRLMRNIPGAGNIVEVVEYVVGAVGGLTDGIDTAIDAFDPENASGANVLPMAKTIATQLISSVAAVDGEDPATAAAHVKASNAAAAQAVAEGPSTVLMVRQQLKTAGPALAPVAIAQFDKSVAGAQVKAAAAAAAKPAAPAAA